MYARPRRAATSGGEKKGEKVRGLEVAGHFAYDYFLCLVQEVFTVFDPQSPCVNNSFLILKEKRLFFLNVCIIIGCVVTVINKHSPLM